MVGTKIQRWPVSFMVNPLKSSIEIELINELCYLKTNGLRSVFRMTSRPRLEARFPFSFAFSGDLTKNWLCFARGDRRTAYLQQKWLVLVYRTV